MSQRKQPSLSQRKQPSLSQRGRTSQRSVKSLSKEQDNEGNNEDQKRLENIIAKNISKKMKENTKNSILRSLRTYIALAADNNLDKIITHIKARANLDDSEAMDFAVDIINTFNQGNKKKKKEEKEEEEEEEEEEEKKEPINLLVIKLQVERLVRHYYNYIESSTSSSVGSLIKLNDNAQDSPQLILTCLHSIGKHIATGGIGICKSVSYWIQNKSTLDYITLFDATSEKDDTTNDKYTIRTPSFVPIDLAIICRERYIKSVRDIMKDKRAKKIVKGQQVYIYGWNLYGKDHIKEDYKRRMSAACTIVDITPLSFTLSLLGKAGSSGSLVTDTSGLIVGIVYMGLEDTHHLDVVRLDMGVKHVTEFFDNIKDRGREHSDLNQTIFGADAEKYRQCALYFNSTKVNPSNEFTSIIKYPKLKLHDYRYDVPDDIPIGIDEPLPEEDNEPV